MRKMSIEASTRQQAATMPCSLRERICAKSFQLKRNARHAGKRARPQIPSQRIAKKPLQQDMSAKRRPLPARRTPLLTDPAQTRLRKLLAAAQSKTHRQAQSAHAAKDKAQQNISTNRPAMAKMKRPLSAPHGACPSTPRLVTPSFGRGGGSIYTLSFGPPATPAQRPTHHLAPFSSTKYKYIL